MPKGVYNRTEYHRDLGRKAMNGWRKKTGGYSWVGKKHLQETREKIKESHKLRLKGWSKPPHLFGENNPAWKGGVTSLLRGLRTCAKYRRWRCDVFERDGYVCVWCGQKGGRINADHIKPFVLIIKENNITSLDQAYSCEELWNTNNGRTLCLACHERTESYRKNKYNLVVQLRDFERAA